MGSGLLGLFAGLWATTLIFTPVFTKTVRQMSQTASL
jgi:hypothetical protein